MIFKSIVSAFLSLVILFSTGFAPVAKASLVGDTVIAYSQATWAQQVMSFILSGAGAAVGGPYGAVAGIIAAEGITSLAEWYANGHTDQELYDAYNQYVSDLQTDLGTTALIGGVSRGGGIRYYFTPTAAGGSKLTDETVWTLTPNSVVGTVVTKDLYSSTSSGHTSGCTLTFVYDNGLTVPFTCTYEYGDSGSFSSASSYATFNWPNKRGAGEANKGTVIYAANSVYSGNTYIRKLTASFSAANIVVGNITYSVWVDIYPIAGVSLPTTNDITINSRPTSITGDYGIIGDNGSIIKVDGNMIVDESSSTVYNPVTNTTLNYTDYAYDYSDRSYNLTLEDGSTMKVTYGDENITINEGDTVYNVYYMVPEPEGDDSGGSGSGSGGDTHTHNYSSEITKQPNCLLSGVRTYSCSCGDSYTKAVPATGHDWLISQQVANTYDPATGEQLTTGYTIYACATCGEQYKSTDGNAPPNGSTGEDEGGGGLISGLLGAVGDLIGGLIEGLLLLATKALEALTGLGALFTEMITTILGFFGGFIDFLSAMFPFLPEETIIILNFGLILMIAAAVFNKFFK